MKISNNYPKDRNSKGSWGSSSERKESLSPENGSHGVALTQSSKGRGTSISNPDISTGFHLTIRISNSSLTRKHFRLMLDCLVYEIVTSGINLEQYLMLEHLMSLLLGTKRTPLELSNEHERRVSLLAQILMRDLRGIQFVPFMSTKEFLSEDIISDLQGNDLVMTKRTYNSRKLLWRPENYMKIQIVSVDTIIDRTGNTERYSSYCKGYGESHPSAHNQKTKTSFELDGGDPKEPTDFSLKEIQSLLLLTQLEIRTKFRKRKT